MMNLLRRGVKTWVAKVLFALLVASFAVWGIGDVFGTSLGSSVATIGDQKITAERYTTTLNREIRAQSERFGQPIDSEMVRAIGLDRQVLSRMAQEATLDQAMEEMQISAPDDAVRRVITADPNFRGQTGAFDQETYRYLISQANFSVEGYENATRRSISRAELARALSDGGAAPQGAIETIYRYQTETRRFDYITLNAADHAGEIPAPDDAALAAFHEEHAEDFTAPERRDATFIHLGLDALGADFEPDEAAVEALYAARASQYDLPERRALYQLVFDAEDEAKAAAERVKAGEATFDTLLAVRGESRADTSLGEVTADDVPEAVGEAAFAAAAPGVVGPVDTGFGFALIDVAAITPAETVSLEDARGELTAELRREAALDRAPEAAGEVQDRIAGGATLEEIAGELGLTLGQAKGVAPDGEGGTGFETDPDFLAELFTAEEGGERDLMETETGEYFVLRVDRVEPSALRPLDEVRGEVEAAWRVAQLQNALDEKAEAIVARLDDGDEMAALADELGLEVKSEGPKTRIVGWDAAPADLVETLFGGEMGAAGYGDAPGRTDAVVIAQVAAIAPGAETASNDALRARLTEQMNAMAGNDALSLYIAAKQQAVGVSVNQQLIDSLLFQTGGGY